MELKEDKVKSKEYHTYKNKMMMSYDNKDNDVFKEIFSQKKKNE